MKNISNDQGFSEIIFNKSVVFCYYAVFMLSVGGCMARGA
jgi:hypothetical protein